MSLTSPRFLLAVALASLACVTRAPADPDAGPAHLEPTLDNIQTHIFDTGCAMAGCHSAAVAAGDLDLSSADVSYAALLDQAAKNSVAAENGWQLVTPGDPELSFLVRKIRLPGLGEGAPMPIGELQLHSYYQHMIEDWIAEGAQR